MPKRMRKILLLYDSLVAAGGAERLFLEEERYFQTRGYDVTTAVFEFSTEALFDYRPEKFVCLHAQGHFLRLARLVKLIWRLRPDLVVAPSNSEAIYLFLASWLAPVRYAAHVHGSHFWFETDKLKYAWLHRKVFERIRNSLHGHREFISAEARMTWRERLGNECIALLDYWAIRRACARIALTNQVAWEIELLYGKKAGVCRGCLSEEWLALGSQMAEEEPKRNGYPRLIFSVGRLDRRKRIDVLLRAFAMVAGGNSDFRLLVGGVGPEAENLHALASQLGIQDQVEFCGFIADRDLPGQYLRAEVFAFPSWTTSGITPYEALAFGCKVVWTSEAEEPVLDLPGVHVADPTPDDFARGLVSALNDSSRPPHEKLENYSWGNYFEGVEQILIQASRHGLGQLASETSPESPTKVTSQERPAVRHFKLLLYELAWVFLFPVQYVPGAAGDRLRRLVWRFFLGGIGKRVHIDVGVQFVNPRSIFVGDDAWIDKYVVLIAGPPHEGKRVICRKPNPEFPAKEGELHIGARCHIAPHSLIQAHGGVWIANDLTVASGSRIYSMSHHYRPLDQPQRKFYRFSTYAKEEDQALIVSPVVIHSGAAVGLNCVVMPGSTIGENSWVGTSSVVQGAIPPNSIAGGVPAEVVREIILESAEMEETP